MTNSDSSNMNMNYIGNPQTLSTISTQTDIDIYNVERGKHTHYWSQKANK